MLDPNIAMGIKGMQLNDPMEQYGKAMALSQMGVQNQFMQSRMAEQERVSQLGRMKQQAFADAGGDPVKFRATLAGMGLHEDVAALDKSQLETQETQGKLSKQQIDMVDARNKNRSTVAQFIHSGATPQHVMQAIQHLSQTDPEAAQYLQSGLDQAPNATPEQIRNYVAPFIAQGLTAEQFSMPKMQSANDRLVNTNPNATAPDIPMGVSPDTVANNMQSEKNQDRIDQRAKETIAVGREANTLIGGKQNFEAEHKLADDHKTESKTFIDLRDGYTRIKASLGNATKSAAATLAGATSFMKLLDPGSVVRESELGMALAASGVLDRATNYHNTLMRGKVLTESQAKDFRQIADKIYKAAEANQRKLDAQYTEKAKGYGLKPENVVKDYGVKTGPEQTEFKSMPPPSDHVGKRIKSDDGTIYKSNGKSWVRE